MLRNIHTTDDMLTYLQRKKRLPFGAGARIAAELGVARSAVTYVLKGSRRNRKVEVALAAVMTPATSVEEAFGAEAPQPIHAGAAA